MPEKTVTRETFDDEVTAAVKKAMDAGVKIIDIITILQITQVGLIIIMNDACKKYCTHHRGE